MKVQRLRMEREEGFTLIELLIVIVILGILAAIVVFSVGGITDRGKKSACKSDYTSIQTAQEAKFAKDGAYAANVAGLVPTYVRQAPTTANGYTITTDATGAVFVDGPDADATGTSGSAECDAL